MNCRSLAIDPRRVVSIVDRLAQAGDRSVLVWSRALTAAAAVGVVAALAGAPGVSLAAAEAAAVASAVLLVRRARLTDSERAVWVRWALGSVPAAVASLVAWAGAPSIAAVLVMGAFFLPYGAAVRWNRYSTSLADPHEAINGIASVIALVAVTDLVSQLLGVGPVDLHWTRRVLVWGPMSCTVIVFTALLTILPVAGLARDRRAWLMLTAVGGIGVLTVVDLVGLTASMTGAVLAMSTWCAGRAALLEPGVLEPRPVRPGDSTVGGFGILLACLGVLIAAYLTDVTGPSPWLAVIAACLSAVRLVRNVLDIAALDTSRQEALTDDLTGIPNRRAVLRRADALVVAGRPLALAIIDLDGFKHINDSLGHAAGDQLLREMAMRLRSVLPDTDLLGRLGGDEFAVVSPLPDDDAPAHLARVEADLLTALGQPVDISGFLLHGSGSVGLTACTGVGGPDVSELLRQADAAMYEAKSTRGTAVSYDPERHAAHGRLQLVEELHTALDEGQLLLHHQPQVDVETGRLVGVEALVRWAHPTRGLLGPAVFIDLAESQGLMGRVTDQVLRQAVSQAAIWRAAGLSLRVSVNLSASNLLDVGLPARVRALLEEHGVPAGDLTLEVTESVLVQDSISASTTMQALSDIGVDLSIDDFGTGWSSLAYLQRLPAQELKLDRSFTADLLTDPRTAAIIASTIRLAHELGLRVVAEGVEDRATLDRLRTLRCDMSQGYLHARPMPAESLATWVEFADSPALRSTASDTELVSTVTTAV